MLERIVNRLRILFSIEFILTLAVISLLFKIPAINSWISPPFTIDTTKEIESIIYQVEIHKTIEGIRSSMIILISMIIVYSVGEIIRRKRKYKSLFQAWTSKKKNT